MHKTWWNEQQSKRNASRKSDINKKQTERRRINQSL